MLTSLSGCWLERARRRAGRNATKVKFLTLADEYPDFCHFNKKSGIEF